jgi:tetratricopeptide (TPR) repeat protein
MRIDNRPAMKPASLVLAVIALGAFCTPAHALQFDPTEAEWAAWPEYCQARYVVSGAGRESRFKAQVSQSTVRMWSARLGGMTGAWGSLHHYCAAIIEHARARATFDKKHREFFLRRSIEMSMYSFDRVPATHPMYADVAVEIANCYRDLGDRDSALQFIEAAIKNQPANAKGYAAKSLVFRDEGKLQDAIDVLQKGTEAVAEDSSMLHYFLGLNYLDLRQYDQAREQARLAYSLGYPLPGLRQKLAAAGHAID